MDKKIVRIEASAAILATVFWLACVLVGVTLERLGRISGMGWVGLGFAAFLQACLVLGEEPHHLERRRLRALEKAQKNAT